METSLTKLIPKCICQRKTKGKTKMRGHVGQYFTTNTKQTAFLPRLSGVGAHPPPDFRFVRTLNPSELMGLPRQR